MKKHLALRDCCAGSAKINEWGCYFIQALFVLNVKSPAIVC